MTKIGFLLSHLGDSQSELAKTFIKNTNAFLDKNTGTDIVAFVNNQLKSPVRPSFASMNINEAFDFDGVVVATDLYTAEKAVKFPGPKRVYYYLWELDWAKHEHGHTFEERLALFNDPRLSLVARTPEDGQLIQDCWNRPVKSVIPDCNTEAFVEMVRRDDT